jgi:hypothetical protein
MNFKLNNNEYKFIKSKEYETYKNVFSITRLFRLEHS